MDLLQDCPYWIVFGDEDGGHVYGPYNTEQAAKKLEPSDKNEGHNDFNRHEFLSAFPKGGFDYWPDDALLLIQGKVIIPKAKKIAMKLEF